MDLFLKFYNEVNNTNYKVETRPEDDKKVNGTYDYLCKNGTNSSQSLAIELAGLHKSESNVRINVNLRRLITELKKTLREKNLKVFKRYFFFVEFKDAPPKKEKGFYIQEMAELIKQVLNQYEAGALATPFRLNVKHLPLVKRFLLSSVYDDSPDITFPFTAADNSSFDVQRDTLISLRNILEDNNDKMKIPKGENKRTILLIANYDVLADEYNIKYSFNELPDNESDSIDEIFFINQKSFSEEYDILKIK